MIAVDRDERTQRDGRQSDQALESTPSTDWLYIVSWDLETHFVLTLHILTWPSHN